MALEEEAEFGSLTTHEEVPEYGVNIIDEEESGPSSIVAVSDLSCNPKLKKSKRKRKKKIKREGNRRPWFDEEGLYHLSCEENEWKLIRLTEGIDMALGNDTNSKEVLRYTIQDFFDKDDEEIMKEVYMAFPQLLDFWKIDDPEYIPKRWDTGKCFWRYFHPRPSDEYIQMIHKMITKRDEEKKQLEITNNK